MRVVWRALCVVLCCLWFVVWYSVLCACCSAFVACCVLFDDRYVCWSMFVVLVFVGCRLSVVGCCLFVVPGALGVVVFLWLNVV